MKIKSIELCGFRGFREFSRLDIPSGFAVINGRNGVGKSTICDAVEFALTGTIAKYLVEKSGKETLENYLWWRGEGEALEHFVKLSFIGEHGDEFTITRTRESGADKTEAQIQSRLCDTSLMPDSAIVQLCRTSIIRDEWISALSLDLTETARFELVRSALGAVEGPEHQARASEIISYADEARKISNEAEDIARQNLETTLTELAQANAEAQRNTDLASAINFLSIEVPNFPVETNQRIAAARNEVIRRREMRSLLGQAKDLALKLEPLVALVSSEKYKEDVRQLTLDKNQLEVATSFAEKKLETATTLLSEMEKLDEVAGSLSAIVEHGLHLGLQDGHCPLCAADRTEEEFIAGISTARKRIGEFGRKVEVARSAAADAKVEQSHLQARLVEAMQRLGDLLVQQDLVQKKAAEIKLLGVKAGIEDLNTNVTEIDAVIERFQNGLINLERAIIQLEASRALDTISALEEKVRIFRKELDEATRRAARARRASLSARELDHAVKRTNAEIIEERLAAISPLLNEIYERLRPHTEWQNINYKIRGDVRRLLSLTVGNELNPQFIFSSGQRRAAGLDFLLSVHLSRPWCRWNTLVMDDPVQHIDDYRALNLVEVLAGLRSSDRQILCAVEDSSLADLMCRRLRSVSASPGKRFDLDLKTNGGTQVVRSIDVPSMPIEALRREVSKNVG